MAFKYFNVKNGLSAGNITLNAANNTVIASDFLGNITGSTASFSGNLIITGTTDLGSVSNVTITGGTAGQVLTTDGNGNLSFSSPTVLQSPSPMPYYIDNNSVFVIPLYYQGLFTYPLTIDGQLEVSGVLVQV